MSRTPLRNGLRALAVVCALAANRPAAAESYITFSVLDGYDTYASSINAAGVIAGSASGTDTNVGFVRAADGTITTFTIDDETVPTAINRNGSIAGYYCSMAGPCHGFLRKPNGKIISFDPAESTHTLVFAINDSDVITGSWSDANFNVHGFLRTADGTITTFDPGDSIDTEATAINMNGDIAGYYWYTQNNAHGFLRTADGTITSFDVKNASYTLAYGINRKDAIVGSGSGTICFERKTDGKTKTFEPGQGPPNPTQASGINDKGQIIGFYAINQPPYLSAFVGSPKPGFTSFEVDGGQTQPFGINENGVIAGSYSTDHGLNGFVRMP
jgi:hypothetical protein